MGQIIWLASYPKSGNTWLRAFLHNYLRRPAEPYDINRLSDFTVAENDAAHFELHAPGPASAYSIEQVQRLRPLVHRDLTQAFPDLVFVKTHNAVGNAAGRPLLTPEVTAGAIYMLRDPRDIAISYSRHTGLSLDATIAFMAEPGAAAGGDDSKVFEQLGTWSGHVLSWTPVLHPRLLTLRYEDMLDDPRHSFGKVVRFLGGEPPPDRLERAIGFSSFATLRTQEQSHGFVERPATSSAFFRAGQARQWREALSRAQISRIERDHGDQMRRFGYLPGLDSDDFRSNRPNV
ncbi:MAG TPA: sulfotransferase domain-containing protein [Aliidongia sp.]|nr:sulfotransferase domain-containing protein [Aliidongia sp.]